MLGLGASLSTASAVEQPMLVTNAKSIDFDGVNDCVDLGNTWSFLDDPDGNEFTIVAWINGASGADVTIFSKADNSNRMVQLYTGTDDKAIIKMGGTTSSSSTTTVTDGNWHHVGVVVRNDGGTYKAQMYIDGSAETTEINVGTTTATDRNFLIGARRNTSNGDQGYLFTGNIDEVAIWNSALTATEVKVIYDNVRLDFTKNSVGYASSSSLQGWWRMGDGDTYQVVADRRKTFFTGSSINFDGTDNFAVIEDHADFTFGDGSSDSAFSVSAWINMDDATDFPIICKDVTSHREWSFSVNPSDELQIFTYDNSASAYIGRKTDVLTSHEGSWIHVAATYDGGGANSDFKLYINGTASDDDDVSSGSYTAMEDKTSYLLIGKDQGGDYANGKITDVAIWNAVLVLGDILKIYNSGEPTDLTVSTNYLIDRTSNLKGYWRLGLEGTGDALPDFGALTSSQVANALITNQAQPITDWGRTIMSFNYHNDDIGGTFVSWGTNGSGTMTGTGTEYVGEMDGGAYAYMLLRARDDSGTSLAITGKAVKITMDIKADATFAGNNFEISNTYTETGGQQYIQPTTSYTSITFYAIPNSDYLGKWQMRTDGKILMKNINVYIGDGAGHAIPSNSAGVTDFEEHAPNRHSGNMINMVEGDRETDVPS